MVAVVAIVVGITLTGIPTPLPSQGSFALGLACAVLGSLCLASSYPTAELLFRYVPSPSPRPAEEFCSFAGGMLNVLLLLVWTLAYTRPRWDALVLAPLRAAPLGPVPSGTVIALYASHALLVGIHSLAFWKTIGTLGSVPAAVSKGAIQAGTFLLAHILYCEVDVYECLARQPPKHGARTPWDWLQKPLTFFLCFLGCGLYAVVKRRPRATRTSAASGHGVAGRRREMGGGMAVVPAGEQQRSPGPNGPTLE